MTFWGCHECGKLQCVCPAVKSAEPIDRTKAVEEALRYYYARDPDALRTFIITLLGAKNGN